MTVEPTISEYLMKQGTTKFLVESESEDSFLGTIVFEKLPIRPRVTLRKSYVQEHYDYMGEVEIDG